MNLDSFLMVYDNGENIWIGFEEFAVLVHSGGSRVQYYSKPTFDASESLSEASVSVFTNFEHLHEIEAKSTEDVFVGDILVDRLGNQIFITDEDYGFITGINLKTKNIVLIQDVDDYAVYSIDDLIALSANSVGGGDAI